MSVSSSRSPPMAIRVPPPKRKREIGIPESPGPATSIRRTSMVQDTVTHSELWYDDGSVVLQAGSTQFRVHRTILSGYSGKLKDILSRGQSPDSEKVDGCPVVYLDDSAQDLSNLMKAIYDREFFHSPESQLLPTVASLLCSSTKYGIKLFFRESITLLGAEFPASLEAWDRTSPEYRRIYKYDGVLFNIINAACDFGFQKILPAAFYACCEIYSIHDIFYGIANTVGDDSQLPHDTKRDIILGLQKLLRAQAEYTLGWLDESVVPSPGCLSPMDCRVNRLDLSLELWKPIPQCRALDAWLPSWNTKLCSSCIATAQEAHASGRHHVWSLLPSLFGLPPWENLLDGPLSEVSQSN